MSDLMQVVGSMTSMVCEPVLCYDWVVPDFLNSTGLVSYKGPDFVVQNSTFTFKCRATRGKVLIWIQCVKDLPTVFDKISLNLVSKDGTEKHFCSATNSDIGADRPMFKLTEGDLTPDFLPNGELRVRCRVEVKGEPAAKVSPMPGQTLVENLRKEYADQSALTFTDCVLVSILCSSYCIILDFLFMFT